jgi:hypothetical protein
MGEQWQASELVADVMDDHVFQTRFDDHPRPGRRSLDDLPELGFPIGPTSAWLSCKRSARTGYAAQRP